MPADLARVAAQFTNFAEVEAPGNGAPFYARLAAVVAADPELCALAAEAKPGQPPPNMLFAAVHFLLAEDPSQPLAGYYASLTPEPKDGDPGPMFREFCLAHGEGITAFLRTHMVQTNEVRRSALLLPGFASVSASRSKPLALIEIGPSAGLNLLFDRYAYDYGALTLGAPASPVRLDCPSRGAPLPLDDGIPRVASRCGIDLNPLDLRRDDDRRWLEALIWPEHADRRALLKAAAEVLIADPPRLLQGDVFELLPREAAAAPPDAALCVFATMVLNQFSPEMLDRLRGTLIDISRRRPLDLVLLAADHFAFGKHLEGPNAALTLMTFDDGEERKARRLAICSPHGRWIEWLA